MPLRHVLGALRTLPGASWKPPRWSKAPFAAAGLGTNHDLLRNPVLFLSISLKSVKLVFFREEEKNRD